MPKVPHNTGTYIKYTVGEPSLTGIYACRLPVPGFHEEESLVLEDVFLMWIDGQKRWAYPSSDQYYRGRVIGWVGPLSRERPKA